MADAIIIPDAMAVIIFRRSGLSFIFEKTGSSPAIKATIRVSPAYRIGAEDMPIPQLIHI